MMPASEDAAAPTAAGAVPTPRLDALPEMLTVPEAARWLRIGRNSAYEAAKRGELLAVRIGRRLLVPRAALERFTTAPGAAAGDGA